MIRTFSGDINPDDAGFVLSHEHVFCDFAEPTGDPDLAFTDTQNVATDLAEARAHGVDILVEVSTYDMGADPARAGQLCDAAKIRMVKSTGWFRSPSLDPHLDGLDDETLTDKLVTDLTDGFTGTHARAGVLGEVGINGAVPTRAESRSLDATVAAALAIGAAVIAHTDTWENALCVFNELRQRGLPAERIMLSHCRVADPLDGQEDLAGEGAILGFDQLGHPKRDSIEAVADRISSLMAAGLDQRIVLSADVGRRSRLRSEGGSGYIQPVLSLTSTLVERGLDPTRVERLTRSNPASFLSLTDNPS